jgi:hypothetical protein
MTRDRRCGEVVGKVDEGEKSRARDRECVQDRESREGGKEELS